MKRILALLLLVPLPLLAQQGSSPVGQVASSKASVDGLGVPSGTTVLDGSRVAAGQQAATIHLSNGRIVRVNSNSTALFTRQQDGGIRVVAERGTVSVRNTDGSTSTLAFSQQPEETGKGAKTTAAESTEPGVVAVVYGSKNAKRAEAGSTTVPVNDPSPMELSDATLLKTNLGRKEKPEQFRQEVVCSFLSADGCDLKTGERLAYTFEPDDFVIQNAPVLENGVYTRLRAAAQIGSKLLPVLDSKAVNPLEPIVVQSVDGRFREPACVKTTTEDLPEDLSKIIVDRTLETPNLPESMVEIRKGLHSDYSRGAGIIQGLRFTDERVVAKLSGNAALGATVLEVEDASGIDPLQQIILRSPGGARTEAYCIALIAVQKADETDEGQKPDRVTLGEGLDHGFPEGSELIQGKSSQEMAAAGRPIQRLTNCDCCGEPLVPVTWWDGRGPWLIGGAAGGAAIRILINEDEPASPSRPRQ